MRVQNLVVAYAGFRFHKAFKGMFREQRMGNVLKLVRGSVNQILSEAISDELVI